MIITPAINQDTGSLSPNQSVVIQWNISDLEPGVYQIAVDGLPPVTLTVVPSVGTVTVNVDIDTTVYMQPTGGAEVVFGTTSGGTLTRTDVPIGETTFRVAPKAGYTTPDPKVVVVAVGSPRVVTFDYLPIADLAVDSFSVTPGSVCAGDEALIDIVVRNNAPEAINYGTDAVRLYRNSVQPANLLDTWNPGTIPANGTVHRSVAYTPAPAESGSTITLIVVTISGHQASMPLTILQAASIVLSNLEVIPSTIMANEATVVYVRATNNGECAGARTVSITVTKIA